MAQECKALASFKWMQKYTYQFSYVHFKQSLFPKCIRIEFFSRSFDILSKKWTNMYFWNYEEHIASDIGMYGYQR